MVEWTCGGISTLHEPWVRDTPAVMTEPAPGLEWFLRVVAFADVAVFLGFGIAFLVAPQTLLGPLDIELGSTAAHVEIRAMYGGLELGIAAFVAWTWFRGGDRRQVFALSGLALGGLAVVRAVGLFLVGLHPLLVQLLVSELIGVAANVAAFRVTNHAEP